MDLSQNIGVLFSELAKIFNTQTVVGEPIVAGNVTLVPIISVSFGAGNGGGGVVDGKGNDNSGGGAGAGGKITPVAIVAVKDDEVSVLPLNGKTPMDKVVALIPDLLAKVKK